ncbi:hypothetical protein NARC_70040 [Candidatus Nitrosocosmicus arcticus]|uniref:Uncharacterized protein n=1 Tax=Candidatus Nitrosocosmicus arcticus TaxID=2035267 RepID=A0A557SV26_9ARCH|nr:hypothetical protein NARC_70040 [Candidatus Nitrosocosmicus arcticus]
MFNIVSSKYYGYLTFVPVSMDIVVVIMISSTGSRLIGNNHHQSSISTFKKYSFNLI